MSDDDKLNAILAGLNKLQSDIDTLSKRIDKVEKKPPQSLSQVRRTKVKSGTQNPHRHDQPARTESMNLSGERPNLFEEQQLNKLHKEDTKIDKLLFAGRTPTPRVRAVNLVEIECCVCGNQDIIHESMVPRDASRYKCNDCISNK